MKTICGFQFPVIVKKGFQFYPRAEFGEFKGEGKKEADTNKKSTNNNNNNNTVLKPMTPTPNKDTVKCNLKRGKIPIRGYNPITIIPELSTAELEYADIVACSLESKLQDFKGTFTAAKVTTAPCAAVELSDKRLDSTMCKGYLIASMTYHHNDAVVANALKLTATPIRSISTGK